MYKVLKSFTDGEKGKAWHPRMGGYFYRVGDTYPKAGFTPSQAHIDYLLGDKNSFKEPIIALQEEKKEAPAKAKEKKEAPAQPEDDKEIPQE